MAFQVLNVHCKGKLIACNVVHAGMMQTLFVPMEDGRQLMISPTGVGFLQPLTAEDEITLSYEVEK